jgi:predicted dinucleotide-binding enzyme
MTIGIIGAGAIGSNIARLFAKSGNRRDDRQQPGPGKPGTPDCGAGPPIKAAAREEAAAADIVFVAVRWVDVGKVLDGLPAWSGRIVVDTTNPVEFLDPNSPEANYPSNPLAPYGIRAVDLGGGYSSELLAEFVPGARLVKAFNHTPAELLPQPSVSGGQRVLFYSGDDAEAKAEVRAIIEKTGHFPVDLGGLDVGGPLTSPPLGSLSTNNFIKVRA